MSKIFIEDASLTAIGDAIRSKGGTSALLSIPTGMVEAINAIETGGGSAELPEEAFNITGKATYKFMYGGWDWFLENYGNKISTSDITDSAYMFSETAVEEIPFDINFKANTSSQLNSMFADAINLKSVPKINYAKPSSLTSLFQSCRCLKEIPDNYFDNWDFSLMENSTSAYDGPAGNLFQSCSSLRKFPVSFLKHMNPVASQYYIYLQYGFNQCYCLDELLNLPIPYSQNNSNFFNSTFYRCSRLKNLTFELNEDGTPQVKEWSNQTIDLTGNVGYAPMASFIINYNSGITTDTQIKDDTTYQTYKDNEDSWTLNINYSRYNHDSAVETINSLPDTSAYGTNTIKFKGASGSLTDGGAINTLTEEEIAVATAKGWTVSYS